MPFDPLTLTLAGARVLLPLYKLLEGIYEKWKLIRSFNKDFLKAQHQLDAQFIILEHIGHRYLHQLENGIDPNDELHPRTRVIYGVLEDIKADFENIDKLLLDYPRHRNKLRKERTVNSDQNQTDEVTPLSSAPSATIGLSSNTNSSPLSSISKIGEKSSDQEITPTQKRPTRAWPNHLKNIFRLRIQPNDGSILTQPVGGGSKNETTFPRAQQLPRNQAGAVVGQLMERNRSTEATVATHETTEVLYKVKWAQQDREKLWAHIEELRKLNRTLDTLTRLRPYSDGSQIQEKPQEGMEHLKRTISNTQNALKRFHLALSQVDSGLEQFSFAIQLTLDYDQAGRLFGEEYWPHKCRSNYAQSSDFYFFNMQGLQRSKANTQKLIVGQTKRLKHFQGAKGVPTAEAELIKDFTCAYEKEQLSRTDAFLELGVVAENPSSRDLHRLFKDCANEWTCAGSLTDFMKGPEASQKLTPADRVGLAKLISASYLYLSRILSSDPFTIKLDSLLYFAVKGESVGWTGDDGLILRPYLLCGLGDKSKSIVGGKSFTSTDHVLEFACLLTQIGCCAVWDTQQPIADTKRWVSQQIDNLNREVGLPYAEIVRECLQHRSNSLPGTNDDSRQTDFLLDKMIRLDDLSTDLAGTLAGERME